MASGSGDERGDGVFGDDPEDRDEVTAGRDAYYAKRDINLYYGAHQESRGRLLESYLAAVRKEAKRGTPRLSDLYVGQLVTSNRGAGTTDAVGALLSDPEPVRVVIAEPGGGKTSLLRAVLHQGAAHWAKNDFTGPLPVRVAAVPLAKALSRHGIGHALAEVVNAELQPEVSLTEQFFAHPPRARGWWLVMVDGLDEVTDPEARMGILECLARPGPVTWESCRQAVVATRPLPPDELRILGNVPRLALLPFSPPDLESAAAKWFRSHQQNGLDFAVRQRDPDSAAREFMAAVTRSGLGQLPYVPLYASLLCQIFARDPDTPLPRVRSQVYQKITDELQKNLTARRASSYAQAREYLANYHQGVALQAENSIKSLKQVIPSAAFNYLRMMDKSVLDVILEHPRAQQPSDIPDGDRDVWRKFLRDNLRRSGLFVEQGGELEFLHPTIAEYLAARHAIDNPAVGEQEFDDIFRHWSTPGFRQPYKLWMPQRMNWSYTEFLVEAWKDRPELKKALRRLARKGGLPAWLFIAYVVKWSGDLDRQAINDAVLGCIMVVRAGDTDPLDRQWARTALTELGSSLNCRTEPLKKGDLRLAAMREVDNLGKLDAALGSDPYAAPMFAYSWTAHARLGDPRRAKAVAIGNRLYIPPLRTLAACFVISLTAATTIVYPSIADHVVEGILLLSGFAYLIGYLRRRIHGGHDPQ